MLDVIGAANVCLVAHEGQTDKGGIPYWKHPFAVARIAVNRWGWDDDLVIVCLLHDVREDTEYNFEAGDLTDFQYNALFAITKDEYGNETYREYIERCTRNPLAAKIKLADLEHNMSPERHLVLPTEIQISLGKRYKWSRDYIEREIGCVSPLRR